MIYISHLIEDKELKKIVQETGAGIETIDFSVSENLDRVQEHLPLYKKRLEYMGCCDLSVHGPFLDLNPVSYDSLVLDATVGRFEAAYQAAKHLGAAQIIYHTCYIPSIYYLEGWPQRMIEFFKSFLEGKEGIKILLENVLDQEIDPIEEVLSEISHPDFGFCLDVGHANCYSHYSPDVWAKQLAPYIRHLHVHDNDGTRDAHRAIGTGNVPFEKVIQDLGERAAEISYTIECNTADDILHSYEKIQVFAECC